jgi:signal transduction histidine kinase
MQACFVSRDEQLREFVAELVGAGICFATPGQPLPPAELYIWDFEPGTAPLASFDAWNHLFLIDRADLEAFAQQAQSRAACVLLKPISRPAFEAFLEIYRKQAEIKSGAQNAQALESDRDLLLQHLLQANLKLQEFDQERTNFLARALHDLRTPITALQGICGLLVDGELGPLTTQQRELISRMHNSSRRLARLGTGMFELSVNGRVQRTLQFEPGDIRRCVDQAVYEISGLAREKELRVASRIDSPNATFLIESHQIEQLLVNLLENACKFTPRAGEIEIHGYPVSWDSNTPSTCELAGPHNAYRVDIRDSGPGIEPSLLTAIFEQYTSYGGANDRSGGGLGLAICKLIACSHGGHIWATSSKRGAAFSVILPFEPRGAVARRNPLAEASRYPAVRAI